MHTSPDLARTGVMAASAEVAAEWGQVVPSTSPPGNSRSRTGRLPRTWQSAAIRAEPAATSIRVLAGAVGSPATAARECLILLVLAAAVVRPGTGETAAPSTMAAVVVGRSPTARRLASVAWAA